MVTCGSCSYYTGVTMVTCGSCSYYTGFINTVIIYLWLLHSGTGFNKKVRMF